jgi:hypothetical protein
MKKLVIIFFGLLILNPLFSQVPNILIGLDGPAYGVKIQANWPGYSGGWARGFMISNENSSQILFGLGAKGYANNGVVGIDYGWIGIGYDQAFMSFRPDGKVGIGTTNPIVKLDVRGSACIISTPDITYGGITGQLLVRSSANSDTDIGGRIIFGTYSGGTGAIGAFAEGTGNASYLSLYSRSSSGIIQERLRINSLGNVGIGTTTPTAKLSVNGDIKAKEVIVTLDGWSDFVFKPTYSLRPLGDVEQFIKTHHFLPDVPSEAEVKANGISLGTMNATLLQKIEELTLYVIEQQKRIDEMEKQNKKIEELQREIAQLKEVIKK